MVNYTNDETLKGFGKTLKHLEAKVTLFDRKPKKNKM